MVNSSSIATKKIKSDSSSTESISTHKNDEIKTITSTSSSISTQKKNGIKKERKCFYYENDKNSPILAAGILFLKEENNKLMVLVQKVTEKNGIQTYSDFGGKIDMDDKTLIDTIARELGEELNNGMYMIKRGNNIILDKDQLKKIIQDNLEKSIYQSIAKYFIAFVKFPDDLFLDMKKIGDFEKLDKINRTVEWINFEQFIKEYFDHNIHPRLWGKKVLEFFGYKGHNVVS